MVQSLRSSLVLMLGIALVGCGTAAAPQPSGTARGAVAALGRGATDDTDLSGGMRFALDPALQQEAIAREGQALVFPTRIIAPGTSRGAVGGQAAPVRVSGVLRYPNFAGELVGAANVTVHLESKGGLVGGAKEVATVVTDADGQWAAELGPEFAGKPLTTSYELGNQRWTLNKYRWAGPAVASLSAFNDTGVRTLDPASENGQAALIHQIWNRALAAFEREGIPLDWWSARIGTNWPASGDFYSAGTVNLTDAKQWDVNGHEIGHSLFFAGFNTAGGGGQHKIDECYSGGLAWSEGFASFFSAVISLPRDDADAKFEFMVPRRKPIRIENVPADVCEGYTNEWRVSAALWDVYDTHADGADRAAVPFKTIWGALVRTHNTPRMSDVRDAFKLLSNAVSAAERPALAEAFAQAGVPVSQAVATRR